MAGQAHTEWIERALVKIWSEELQLTEIQLTDSFVALGGDSMGAMRVLLRIQEQFGVAPGLTDFFQAGSIANTAVLIQRSLSAAGVPDSGVSDAGFI
jgi:acyl carrier protein